MSTLTTTDLPSLDQTILWLVQLGFTKKEPCLVGGRIAYHPVPGPSFIVAEHDDDRLELLVSPTGEAGDTTDYSCAHFNLSFRNGALEPLVWLVAAEGGREFGRIHVSNQPGKLPPWMRPLPFRSIDDLQGLIARFREDYREFIAEEVAA
ncbi:MAG: hypothetical protein VKI83_07710 [Synechococcaceae cyanobacterium]|nr:hypothetical protein [Synechococcaceae cyanobacterium]